MIAKWVKVSSSRPKVERQPYIDLPYDEQVEQEIRKKYSLSQELAIQRQRDTKPQEFKEYFEWCEFCKQTVKERMGVIE